MENHVATTATATATVAVSVEEVSVRPRQLRPTARRPRMRWEYSLAENTHEAPPADLPQGEISYPGLYHFREFGGYKQKMENGLSVL